jgi:predicted nucleotidyltransferase
LGEFAEFLRGRLRPLRTRGISYVIVGGVLTIYYGRPRLTQDVDVIIHPRGSGTI